MKKLSTSPAVLCFLGSFSLMIPLCLSSARVGVLIVIMVLISSILRWYNGTSNIDIKYFLCLVSQVCQVPAALLQLPDLPGDVPGAQPRHGRHTHPTDVLPDSEVWKLGNKLFIHQFQN